MKAIILAGGLGERLRSVIGDRPKPMAPVGGKPFLEYLIVQVRNWGIKEIILSVGYMREMVKAYFGDGRQWGVHVEYSEEEQPLGTGGAVRKAIEASDGAMYLAMNGDSFVDFDMQRMISFHTEKKAFATIGLFHVKNAGRYGTVQMDEEGRVHAFVEKGYEAEAYINAGLYLFPRKVIDFIPSGTVSLERDVLPGLGGLYGIAAGGYFIDIGLPETYHALCKDPSPLIHGLNLWRK